MNNISICFLHYRWQFSTSISVTAFTTNTILGDPGAVSRVGKFSSTGERAPGYRLSPSYFQKFKRMRLLIGHKKCFVLLCPIREQFFLSSFREFVHDGYCFDHGLSDSCTKEINAVTIRESVPRGSFAHTWNLSSRPFSRPDWLPLGLRGCTNTRPRRVYLCLLKPEFSWTSISCFHGRSHAL